MKQWKKLLALVLTLAMVLPMVVPAAQVSAAQTETQAALPVVERTASWDFESAAQANDFAFYQSATSRFQVADGKLISDGLDGELKAVLTNTPGTIRSLSVEIHPGASGKINAGLYVGASNAANGGNAIEAQVFQIQSDFTGWSDAPNRIDIIHGQFNNNWKELGRVLSESGRGNALFTKGKKEALKLELTFSEDVLLLTLSLVSNPAKYIHVMYQVDAAALSGQIGLRVNGNDAAFDNLQIHYDEPLNEYQKLWDFSESAQAQDFNFYGSGTSNFSVSGGMLKTNGGNGEMKAMLKEDMANIAAMSVDIIPGASGLMNAGVYLGAQNPKHAADGIDALCLMVESMFSGWSDAPNRIDLWLGKFNQGWGGEVAGSRYVSETGNRNALYAGGVKKALNLKLEFGESSVTVTMSLLENPNRSVQTTMQVDPAQLQGMLGLRNNHIDLCYDNLIITYKEPVEQTGPAPEADYENQGYNFFTATQGWEMKQEIATPYTLEAWVKVPQGISDYAAGQIVGNPYRSPYLSMEMIAGGDLRLAWSVENADLTTSVQYFDVATDLRNGKWTHVAYSCDVAADTVTAYINGQQVGQWTDAGLVDIALPDHVSPDNWFMVGCRKDSEGDISAKFPGWIADVRLWDHALSASEIQTSMLTQYTTAQGLLFNAPLEAGDFSDVSGNGNHLQPNVAGLVLETQEHAAGAYSMVVIPDPQILNHYNPDLMLELYQWIADNREKENIQMVMCVGDMIDNCGNLTQWDTAKAAWELLPADLPFIVAPGNHDYDTNSGWDKGYGVREQLTLMNQYFPTSLFQAYSTDIGFFDENNSVNQWQAFCVNGNNYLVIALEYVPQDDVIAWANQVVEAHPNHQVIMITHSYMGSYGNVTRTKLWTDFLSQHDNIIMNFSGHVSHTDVVHRTDKGVNGNDVHQILMDAQLEDVSGQYGMIGMLRFNADGTVCDITYYSTLKDMYETRSSFTVQLPKYEQTFVAQVNGEYFTSLSQAAAQGAPIQLLADVNEQIALEGAVTIDLAGHKLSGITAQELYLVDTVGGGTASVSGQVASFSQLDGADYLVVNQEGLYSAHSYRVEITHISLDPANDALGYKAQLVGDETVLAHAQSVGFNLWVNEDNVKTYAVSGKQTVTLRLKSILKNNGGEMNINATAFVTLSVEGQTLTQTGSQQTTTMQKTLQMVDKAWTSYTAAQRSAVKALCDRYADTVRAWGLENIFPVNEDGAVKESYEAVTGAVKVNHISGYTADGKLTAPNNGEGKVILTDTPSGDKTISVELYPDANGINGGIYLGASGVSAAQDSINAVYVGVEAHFSGWADAVNRVDLIVGQFPWTEYSRVLSETGRGNNLFNGAREPLLLTVRQEGNQLTATVSLLADPSKFITTTVNYTGSCDLAGGQVGLRSQYSSCSFDNFQVNDVTYTFDNEAQTAGLQFYHAANANGIQATANNTLMLHSSATFTQGTLAATFHTAGKNGAGIVFGADNTGKNYYLLRVTNNQWVELVQVKNGLQTVVDRGFLSAGHDYNANNRLEVVLDGDTVYCYYYNRFEKINCYAVNQVELAGDRIGLWAQTSGTVFRDVTMTAAAQNRTADVLIFGHSYTEMWGNYETYFPEYTDIDDIGIGGSVAVHWESLVDEVITYQPQLGIYNIGINDLTGGTPPQAVIESVEKALLQVKEALPQFQVVLVSVSHCPARNTLTAQIAQTNALMRNLAASYDWIYYAEAEYLFCTDPSDPLSTDAGLFIDGLHPSAAGYQLMADVIRSAIRGENQPEFDEALAASQFQTAKAAKLASVEIYGEKAYTAENWAIAEPYYTAALAKINGCTNALQLSGLDLSQELAALQAIPGKAASLMANLANPQTRDALAADHWQLVDDNTLRVSGYSYALDNTALCADSEMVFCLSGNTGDVATGGIFLRATQKANNGIEGYLINYVTSGNYLQVYYVNNVYNTDGSSFVLQYIGGIAFGAYGNLVDTQFYAKIQGQTLYLNTLARHENGETPLVEVDLTYGGQFDLFESGYTGVLSWNTIAFDMTVSNYATAQVEDNTLRVLAIGNSFSVDGMEYVYQIAQDLGVEDMELGNLYIGGCSLDTHYNNLQSGAGAYTYYYNNNGQWESVANYSLPAALQSKKWDVIMVQQVSGSSGEAASYAILPDLIAGVKEFCPDAKLGWHMTWAYQGNSTHADFAKYNSDQITMYNAITAAVQDQILTNADIDFVIPAGTAVQNARTSYLGDTLTRDGYHLSNDIGRFIAGITWVEAITGLDASNLTYRPQGVTEEVMAICVESAKNASATPFAVTNSQYTLENCYIQLDLNLTSGWYDSTNTSGNPQKVFASTSSLPFYKTKIFSKAELPVGSIIVYTGSKTYRPEGWVDGAGTVRPNATGASFVMVTEQWWGEYTERAFNIGVASLDVTAAQTAESFQIYVPVSAYEKVELTVKKAFYNSYLYPASQTQAADAGLKFFTVQTFTEETLPVGSIIVNTEGRNIRLERWIDGTVKNSDGTRGNNSTAKQHVVDASWWDGFDTRAFNIPVASLDDSAVAALLETFIIYVPKN